MLLLQQQTSLNLARKNKMMNSFPSLILLNIKHSKISLLLSRTSRTRLISSSSSTSQNVLSQENNKTTNKIFSGAPLPASVSSTTTTTLKNYSIQPSNSTTTTTTLVVNEKVSTLINNNNNNNIGGGIKEVSLSINSTTIPLTNVEALRKVVSIARPETSLIAISLASLFVTSSVSLLLPLGLGHIFDISLNQANAATVVAEQGYSKLMESPVVISSAFLGLFALQGSLMVLRTSFLSIAGERIVARIRKRLFASLMAQELAFFEVNRTGDLLSRLSSDAHLVQKAITGNIMNGTRAAVMVIGGATAMIYTAPQLSLISLTIIPPIAIGGRFFGRYVKKRQTEVQESLAQATTTADIAISGIKTVRQNVAEIAELERYSKRINQAFLRAIDAGVSAAWFDGAVMFVTQASLIGVLGYGGTLVANHTITAGQLSSFMMYSMYVGFNIATLTNVYSEIMRASGASSRIFAIIDREPKMDPGWEAGPGVMQTLENSFAPSSWIAKVCKAIGGAEPPLLVRDNKRFVYAQDKLDLERNHSRLRGHVRLENVHFSYPGRVNEKILRGVNMTVPAGTSVAIVGQSGSGKSTILSLVTRLYDPDQGRVFLDGMDVKDLPPQWLRRQIGVVQQEPILLGKTIADNLRYSKPDATLQEMEYATEAAGALGFIRGLSKQFDTVVGERGGRLSGGQRQRIAIARALMTNAPIIVMDESSSSLDAETEFHMLNAVEKMTKDRTLISVAHRLSTTKRADVVIVLNKGEIVETGSHEELMKTDTGIYRELIKRQL